MKRKERSEKKGEKEKVRLTTVKALLLEGAPPTLIMSRYSRVSTPTARKKKKKREYEASA